MRKICLTLVFCAFSISGFSDSGNLECAKKNLVNVEVNGMVCDFCARALEKVFSKNKKSLQLMLILIMEKFLLTLMMVQI